MSNPVATSWDEWLRSSVSISPDGRRTVTLPNDDEQRALQDHSAAWATADRERTVQAEAISRVNAKLESFASLAPRERLHKVLGLHGRSVAAATIASMKARSCSDAVTDRDAAQAALDSLDQSVAAASAAWVKDGGAGPCPDGRVAERVALQDSIRESERMAALVADTGFEAEVSKSVVSELSDRLPGVRCDVLLSEASAPIGHEIIGLVTQLRAAYCALASIREAAGEAGSVSVKLPSVDGIVLDFVAKADASEVAQWKQRLKALESDPFLPVVTTPRAPQTPRRASLRRLLSGRT